MTSVFELCHMDKGRRIGNQGAIEECHPETKIDHDNPDARPIAFDC